MHKIWEAIGVLLITAMVIQFLLGLIAPYAPFMALAIVVLLAGRWLYARHSRW